MNNELIFTTIAQAKRLTKLSYIGGVAVSQKLVKNTKVSGHYTYCIYLAPANSSGYNVCANSSPECREGCLATSGHAAIDINSGHDVIGSARRRKSQLINEHPEFFMRWVIAEMKHYQAKAKRDGYQFSARLNGTSDIDFTKILVDGKTIFEIFPEVTFYDYTKNINRYANKPANYHLTFSYTGRNWDKCVRLLNDGYNVAVIFNIGKGKKLPDYYKGCEVIDGDLTDLRVGEAKGIIIGLRWKRIANKVVNDKIKSSIFVIQPDDPYAGMALSKVNAGEYLHPKS